MLRSPMELRGWSYAVRDGMIVGPPSQGEDCPRRDGEGEDGEAVQRPAGLVAEPDAMRALREGDGPQRHVPPQDGGGLAVDGCGPARVPLVGKHEEPAGVGRGNGERDV